MKRGQKISHILIGIMISLLFSQLITPALAALAKKTVEVYTGVSIYIDDVKLNPKDAQGNTVEPFVYNGTVFLPARAIGEALGKVVQWDSKANSAYLGKHESTTPAVWLKDLDYFTSNGAFHTSPTDKDNLGETHTNNVTGNYTRLYKLNGQYTKMSGVLFQRYDQRSEKDTSVLTIYGDNNLLYTSTMTSGIEPINFDIDLSGVLELKIDFSNYANLLGERYIGHAGAIGDCGLYT